jgi:hypothetical protein
MQTFNYLKVKSGIDVQTNITKSQRFNTFIN